MLGPTEKNSMNRVRSEMTNSMNPPCPFPPKPPQTQFQKSSILGLLPNSLVVQPLLGPQYEDLPYLAAC